MLDFDVREWKENLKNPEFVWKIPVAIMLVIVLITALSFGVKLFQMGGAQKELVQAQEALDTFNANLAKEEEQDAKTVSALSMGRKVADLESEYSRLLTKQLSTNLEPGEEAIANADTKKVVESLSSYFKDDSYEDAWFSGSIGVSQPYWDFGTKYNINSDETTFPVIWVCYDGMVGGDVLACTTALFHVDTEQFSDAVTVHYDIRDMFNFTDSALQSSLLAALQKEPVVGLQLHEPLENELINNSEVSESDDTDAVSEEESDTSSNEDSSGNETTDSDDESQKETQKPDTSGEGLDPIDGGLSLD